MARVPFLALSVIQRGDTRFEIASRPRLDTRQVLPFFVDEAGVYHVGILERARVGRRLAGTDLVGWEAVGVDFGGVDETGDILSYGRAVFSAHAGVEVDDTALALPLPSHARSIGFLTELGLPLLLPVKRPADASYEVSWAGETHTVRFVPLAVAVAEANAGTRPVAESLSLLLLALWPQPMAPLATPPPNEGATAWLDFPLRSRDELAARLLSDEAALAPEERREIAPDELRFLAFHDLEHAGGHWELVVPASGVSLAVLPYVETPNGKVYFLYEEPRVASLERSLRTPLFDLPTSASFVNAAGCFLTVGERDVVLSGEPNANAKEGVVAGVLARSFPGARLADLVFASPPLETCPGTTTERRVTTVVRLEAAPERLPPHAFAIHEAELVRAVGDGLVHDPVVALALLSTGADPFAAIRDPARDPRARRRFLDRMTEGSLVQRRLRTYSSIEHEQLGSITYARLMLVLQHRYGVRIVYPETEQDRSFFKAAFRVFMAADREEHRALQGLHWSHDAYHFALGNYTLPGSFDFQAFYESDDAAPPAPTPEEEADYVRALKAAEDEATFFSFFTLFAEEPSLTRHVGKLTFWEAMRDLGLDDPLVARRISDRLTVDAVIPDELTTHPLYAEREDVRSLFAYMQGFCPYHHKDIQSALGFARKDAYRSFYLRYGLYESDADRYVAKVRAFPGWLARQRGGLHPLLAALSDAKVGHALLVWDVTKALRLLRTATAQHEDRATVRRGFVTAMQPFLAALDDESGAERALRERIEGAELTARNEVVADEIDALAARLDRLHDELWNAVGALSWLPAETIDRERARQLPR